MPLVNSRGYPPVGTPRDGKEFAIVKPQNAAMYAANISRELCAGEKMSLRPDITTPPRQYERNRHGRGSTRQVYSRRTRSLFVLTRNIDHSE